MSRVVSYSIGLLLAIGLTLAAFGLASIHAIYIIPGILLLAMVQLAAQLIFFLHLGRDKEARWNTALFCFTFFGILVIVVASVWIMNHLNYNMTPAQVNQYTIDQSGL